MQNKLASADPYTCEQQYDSDRIVDIFKGFIRGVKVDHQILRLSIFPFVGFCADAVDQR